MRIPLRRRLQSAVALAAFFSQAIAPLLPAQTAGVPQLMNYEGRVTIAGTNFHGTGYFKFSLVDGGADQNRPATATAIISNSGRVTGVTLTDGGRGYVVKPDVSFAGTGTGATATATITGDTVTAVTVTKAGGGYSTLTPTHPNICRKLRSRQTLLHTQIPQHQNNLALQRVRLDSGRHPARIEGLILASRAL